MKDFPLYRSVRAAVAGTLLLVLPMLFLSFSPVEGLYLAALLVFLGPAALCLSAAVCGTLPTALGCAAALLSMGRVFGARGALLTAVYLGPVVAAFFVIVIRRIPFRAGCAAMIATHAAAFVAVYLILRQWAGGDLYKAAGNLAMDALDKWELGDYALYEFYAMGLVDLPASLAEGVRLDISGLVLSDAARHDLLLSVNSMVSSTLSSIVPGLIIARQSILGGVGCLLLPLRFGCLAQQKREQGAQLPEAPAENGEKPQTEDGKPLPVSFPDLGMPDFSRWYIPRGIGWQVGAALALGLILMGSAVPALNIAGLILYYGAGAVFTVQGAAMMNFSQKMRGTKRVWRVIVPLILLPTALLMIVGIFDQIVNVRGLRKPPEPKEEF